MATVLSHIVASLAAEKNCENQKNTEWAERHRLIVERLIADYLPQGSGFDQGTEIGKTRIPLYIEFSTAYHHMDDAGMYDGWTYHNVRVSADLMGVSIHVKGRSKNGIKDYIGECFHQALMLELRDDVWRELVDSTK